MRTQDICLATSMLSLERPHELSRFAMGERGRAWFEFEDSPRLQEDLKLYYDRKMLVNPTMFFYNLKQLKNRIYTAKEE